MSVDPADDCTFWYTQEYYQTSSQIGWKTRIGSFKFPGCGGPRTVTVTATPSGGTSPLAVAFSAAVAGGVAPLTYAWTFGDGATGTGASPSHTYSGAGTFTASATVTDSLSRSATGSVTVTVTVPPPVIATARALANPFRLKLTGSNFHAGCTLTISGTPAPVTYKNSGTILAKGTSVKALLPKGVTVQLVVTNTDDGGVSAAFSFTR